MCRSVPNLLHEDVPGAFFGYGGSTKGRDTHSKLLREDSYSSCEEEEDEDPYTKMYPDLQTDTDVTLNAGVEEIYDTPQKIPVSVQYQSQMRQTRQAPRKPIRTSIGSGRFDPQDHQEGRNRKCSLSTVKRILIGDLVLEIPGYSEVERINDSSVYIVTNNEEITVSIKNKKVRSKSICSTKL